MPSDEDVNSAAKVGNFSRPCKYPAKYENKKLSDKSGLPIHPRQKKL